jgi:hypothetical protein
VACARPLADRVPPLAVQIALVDAAPVPAKLVLESPVPATDEPSLLVFAVGEVLVRCPPGTRAHYHSSSPAAPTSAARRPPRLPLGVIGVAADVSALIGHAAIDRLHVRSIEPAHQLWRTWCSEGATSTRNVGMSLRSRIIGTSRVPSLLTIETWNAGVVRTPARPLSYRQNVRNAPGIGGMSVHEL